MSVPSPCRLICRYDPEGICVGCMRNKEEISGWTNFDDARKLDVWQKIRERKSNAY
jgi:hypothetical protein